MKTNGRPPALPPSSNGRSAGGSESMLPVWIILSGLIVFVSYMTYKELHPKPIFKVGDCYVYFPEEREAWEVKTKDSALVYKVLEVGKKKYRISYGFRNNTDQLTDDPIKFQEYHKKVNCKTGEFIK